MPEKQDTEVMLELSDSETLEGVLADADAVFGWDDEVSYKERAHEYLVLRVVGREPGDTAVQRVVKDLVERASNCSVDSERLDSMRRKLVEVEMEIYSMM